MPQVDLNSLKKLLEGNQLDAATAAVIRSAIALQSAEPARFAIIAPKATVNKAGKPVTYPAKFEVSANPQVDAKFAKVWGVDRAAIRAILASPDAARAALDEIDSKYPAIA